MVQPPPPPHMGYTPRPEHPQAQAVLVLGIVGIFVPIVPFVAWYLGGKARREILNGAPYAWDGSLKVGYILGIVLAVVQIVATITIFVSIIMPLLGFLLMMWFY